MPSEDRPNGAVVSLVGEGESTAFDPWMLLATQRAALVTWAPKASEDSHGWGPELSSTSQLAQQLMAIISRAGASPAILNGPAIFTLELPTGSTLQHLVPALGGGYRGMVRGARGISGHARLVPVSGAGVGAGAAFAIGPLVALVALAVGAEMLARHQQDQRLRRLELGIKRLEQADQERTAAELGAASEALELGRAALVDRIAIPSSVGLGAARNNLRDIRNRAVAWLEEWEREAGNLPAPVEMHVPLQRMDALVSGASGSIDAFPVRVATLFHALCLDSRATLLTSVEAALANPNVELPSLEAQLQSALATNTETQDRLRALLWRLAERPIFTPFLTSKGSTEAKAYRLSGTLAKLAEAAARTPDAPGILNDSGRQILELHRQPDGSLRILAPTG
ncbi:hypothetical protein Q9R29_08445 [Rothia sp. ARF10]|nr:hypothetical protein [Rothia sp. ARF10]